MQITTELVDKIHGLLDKGLVCGMGQPIPGQMCVEAAICYALELPHSDDPGCVDQSIREFKIKLNDSRWSSNAARAEGLRGLAIAQLGTKDSGFDVKFFAEQMSEYAIRVVVPFALRSAAKKLQSNFPKFATELQQAADRCEQEGSQESAVEAQKVANAAYAAYAAYADYAANYAANYAAAAAANYAAANAANAANAAADYAAAAAAAAAADYAANAAYAAAANAAANAAYAAAGVPANEIDEMLTNFANFATDVLIMMDTPGSEFI